MRLRRMAAGIVLGGVLALGGVTTATAAPATEPVDVSAGLVDQAGALTPAEETSLKNELSDYDDATGQHVYVAFVPSFTDPTADRDWATATARASGISSSEGAVVLAIATRTRRIGFATSPRSAVDDTAVQQVVDRDLTPKLAQKQWAAGVASFLTGLEQAQGVSAGSGTSNDGAAAGTASGSGAGGTVLTVLLLVALAVVILVLVRVLRRRRAAVTAGAGGSAAPVGAPPVDQKELDQQASRALIALDDDLTTSEQELGFASAEFGDGATAEFAKALQAAKTTSRQAFEIRQRLDDDIPETPDQRRSMTQQIIALCTQAEQTLTAQTKPFDELRKLEQQLPAAIPAAAADRDRLSRRADEATTALDALRTQFGDPAVQGAADDLRQSRDLITLAGTALAQAQEAAAGGRGGEGALALRSGQQALGQAGTLLDGIVAAPGEFMSAKRRLDAAIDDTRADIAEAERLQSRQTGDRRALTAAIRDARGAVEAAALQAPTAGLAAVEAADGVLDSALATLRDDAERLRRATATLPRTLDAAQQSIASCKRFIDSRRGGIGSEARTRISEAQRELDRAVALEHDDPVAALQSAQHAQSLASTAFDLAQQDVDDFRSGGGYGGGMGGGGGNVLGGAVLAGVLGGILGGGMGGGGYGGGYGGGGGWAGGDGGGGWNGGGFGGGGDGGWGGGGGGFGGGDGGGGGGGF